GPAIGLANGNLVGGLVELTSTGGVFNASLANVTTGGGPFSLGTGALSGATADEALRIDGGNGSFSYAGTITNSASRAVTIQNKSGGTVTLSGSINPMGAARGILVSDNSTGANTITFSGPAKRISTGSNPGVALQNNLGATIEFTNGGLEIATTSGAGFRATGGGTVLVTGLANTIASTTGTALTVTNTTIGAGGLVFRSISSNGAANGILLDTTGNTAGLTVTGDGGGAANGSGGSILGSTGIGVRLTDTRDVNLGYLNVQGSADAGIKGINLTNFALARSNVTNNGNSTQD